MMTGKKLMLSGIKCKEENIIPREKTLRLLAEIIGTIIKGSI